MPDTPSIVIVKSFVYRGQPEEWSNKYHFTGVTPDDAAEWLTLIDGWANAERGCYTAGTKVVRAYGYEAGSNHANFVHDYTNGGVAPGSPGTFAPGTGNAAPGDAAATVRWSTGDYNRRGKLIYCRKYFHDVWMPAGGHDTLHPDQAAAIASFAGVVTSGFFPGGARYCGPQGADLDNHTVDPFITTRTLKRRGKRPLALA